MTITRVLAVAAILTSTLLGLAGPARADQVMEGIYDYTQGDIHAELTIYPICVPTVGDLRNNLELPVACTLHVQATPTTNMTGGDARLTGGLWTYSNSQGEGTTCPDGSKAPSYETFKIDDVTMTGTRSVANNPGCGLPAGLVKYPFTLTYDRPLANPVDRYPLYCDPGGLKRCR